MSKRNSKIKLFKIHEIYLAYRKAKSEAFFENTHYNAIAYATYEKDLDKNLRKLLKRLNDPDDTWDNDRKFIGGHMYAPKGLDDSIWNSEEIHYRALDPTEDCELRFEKSGERARASFRLMITPTVDYQVITALWIIKVGIIFESRIDRSVCYGNRLRTLTQADESGNITSLNTECSGLFQPYFSAYREWRENGLSKIKESLNEEERIIAITMDIKGFYHNVSPYFILRESFLNKINLELNTFEKYFTKRLLTSFSTWYKGTPDFLEREEGALPVGLSASKIFSNILLCQFDEAVQSELSPIYYGRYVDDIFLVLPSWEKKILSGSDVIEYIAEKLKPIAKYEKKDSALKLSFPYTRDSELILPSNKQRIFNLASKHGLDLIESISNQIRQQSSEYRLLADVPTTNVDMAAKALLATPDATLNADALRKADVISVRRLGFSLLLRDLETYERDLSPESWSEIRKEFYDLVHRHIITYKGIFDFHASIPRVFGIMIACRDFDDAHTLLSNTLKAFDLLTKTTTAGTSESNKFASCKDRFAQGIIQNILQASTGRGFKNWTALSRLIREANKISKIRHMVTPAEIKNLSQKILYSDWGRRPYKDHWYYDNLSLVKSPKIPREISIHKIIRLSAIRNFRKITELSPPYWPALTFPTRPLKISEIGLIAPSLLSMDDELEKSIMALRGARVHSVFKQKKFIHDDENHKRYINVPEKNSKQPSIALTNIKVTQNQWKSCVEGKPDHSLERYNSISKIINRILQDKNKPNYIVLPECSTPARWAISFSEKLTQNRISLIAGLEYRKDKRTGKLKNEALISLTTEWPGYQSNIIFTQAKLKPSHEEKRTLQQTNKSRLFEPSPATQSLPIYFHGNFSFGTLICSDLTNISNRKHFQGEIDALFVLEWNQDINTFSYLVESAAHDINTFVVQVNNRLFGDSRIRAPYKKDYYRDSVRVKGGTDDYYVTGLIDYISLRKFHFNKNYGKKAFKPVPIGFNPSNRRRP